MLMIELLAVPIHLAVSQLLKILRLLNLSTVSIKGMVSDLTALK